MKTVFTIKAAYVDDRSTEWAEELEEELRKLLRKYCLLMQPIVVEDEITGNITMVPFYPTSEEEDVRDNV